MKIITGSANLRGFDCNAVVTGAAARAMFAAGYRFAVRYVRRESASVHDLSRAEIDALFAAGLAVMPVQHVESETNWAPTDQKGRTYGDAAADAAIGLRVWPGTTVWLDLEGVAPGVDAESIIRYCNYWHDRVAKAGFQPGIYVGWHCGLTPAQLYGRLKFARYWGAYNLNADEYPATCGIGMKQKEAKVRDTPLGVALAIDVDVIIGDALGRYPTLCAPAEWSGT